MDDAIVALPTPSLTALMRRSLKRRKWSWEATCPELSISVSAEQRDEARDASRAAVEEFLATAAPKEIEVLWSVWSVWLLVQGALSRNAACNFYEKRLNLDANAAVMELVKRENASYLEISAQQNGSRSRCCCTLFWR